MKLDLFASIRGVQVEKRVPFARSLDPPIQFAAVGTSDFFVRLDR